MPHSSHGPLRDGIGGPISSGKTLLAMRSCWHFSDRIDLWCDQVAGGQRLGHEPRPEQARS